MHQAAYNWSVSVPTIAVAETQPFSILSFYVAAAAHIRLSAASGKKRLSKKKVLQLPDNLSHAWLNWAFPRSPHVDPLS